MRINNRFVESYTVCPKEVLDKKLKQLLMWGWSSEDVSCIKRIWEQLNNWDTESLLRIHSPSLQKAVSQGLVAVYFSSYC